MENLPLLHLPGNPLPQTHTLNTLQQWIEPHLYTIETLYWCAFFGMATYLITTFILLPLCQKLLQKTKSNY
ncbi:MAG: hypothetical protein EBQ80_02140 [Proteobacteria bacterium]|nr:hypothetical protein [Pseudomonadota bacterium]